MSISTMSDAEARQPVDRGGVIGRGALVAEEHALAGGGTPTRTRAGSAPGFDSGRCRA